ncbi:MAG: NADH-quinone oxidoreductase subunit J [Clostridia bacterium]|jgi:NADH-quinone oxidoreductase subunit J|nr:NADH-quinone oxidoreductase subunit J [Clostridia bacterium]
MVSPLVFWIVAGITIIAALAVVNLTNLIHSALWLIVAFVGVAITYLILEAEFLAAVQIIVYAGAIAILIVFGVMLTRRGDIRESNLFNNYRLAGGLISLGLMATIVTMVVKTQWAIDVAAVPANSVGLLAQNLLGQFVIPFEIAAMLLLVALVGAIIIAKEVRD